MKASQNIIFFSNTLWFLGKFKNRFIKQLSKNNKITCIYLRKGPILKEETINELTNTNKVFFFSLKQFLQKQYLENSLSFFRFQSKKTTYQKIIVFTIGPILLSLFFSKSNKKKTVYVLEGMGRIFSSKRRKYLIIKYFIIKAYRFLFKNCKNVCVLNSYDALFLVENNISSINKIVILPGNGLNINRIDEGFENKKYKPKYIDYIGRIIVEKGFYKFLFIKNNFLKYYPEFERKYIFRVICPEEDIRKLSKNEKSFLKKQEIEIKPYLTSALDYYKESSALIVPSSYGEGLSGVVLEACYLGIPVLASRSRGIQEYFPHDYKYFIKSYNPFSMSQQLAEMLKDDKYFDEIRELIKLNIKNNYSTEKAIEEFNANIFNM
ncbi:MAG: glycosyltransferase [Prochlorococcus marinus CUG1436]|nr:glycosyltransferase [Prochlorococcus marinus CUG1436]